ncbi:MAG: hypothetical protein Q4D55_04175 [Eubacteriales bacterium]|nr:hypothetical protein [Eubacteriales bacterium]
MRGIAAFLWEEAAVYKEAKCRRDINRMILDQESIFAAEDAFLHGGNAAFCVKISMGADGKRIGLLILIVSDQKTVRLTLRKIHVE